LHSLRREKDQTMNSDIAAGGAQKLLFSNGGAAP